MSSDCETCPALRAEIQRLAAIVVHLQGRLAEAGGEIAATSRFINGELQKRTMPVLRMVDQVRERLTSAYNVTRGR